MAKKNDDRILELKKQIETKKKELASKKKKFSPKTNCVIELDGIRHNLNVLQSDVLKLLLIKLNSYVMSAKNLEIEVPEISGYSIELWISDIKNKLEYYEIKKKEKELGENEKLLEQLLSEDKKTELMIDEIAALLS